MSMELPKHYDPREAQQRWLRFWNERGFFHARPDANREPFCIVIPPPNVTGALHLGHALNNTLQDVLVRWRRMQGYDTLWMPGTDHAGIATQAVVERRLRDEEKKTRHDLGREELVQRIWQWKDQYEKRILGQLSELGCSCDWQRTRFTLDPMCARAVRTTFFKMFKDGLIFRGKRLVNWDAQLQTSVADDEVENVKQKGKFYYFRYPVLSGASGTARSCSDRHDPTGDDARRYGRGRASGAGARTRQARARSGSEPGQGERQGHARDSGTPRTAATPTRGDAAASGNAGGDGSRRHHSGIAARGPQDPAYRRPLCRSRKGHRRRQDHARPRLQRLRRRRTAHEHRAAHQHLESGRHHQRQRHGRISRRKFSYTGLDRMEARGKVVEDLQDIGLFDREEDIENTIPLSDRSKTPIEPYLSDQWFVRMGDADGQPGLAQRAIDAVKDGRVRFFPERYAKTYLDWLGEKRDWCISRQLWWGHRIPIWYAYCPENELKRIFAAREDVTWRLDEDNGRWLICALEDLPSDILGPKYPLEQDADVLDTWFSSALWPHSTLGWPEQTPELAYWYPTSVLVTSRDIITLWVARMVMTGLYNLDKVPFHHVYIHPKILDGFGETMSKTQGQRHRSARHHRALRHRRPAFPHGPPGDRDAGQQDAGGQRVPALRYAGAGQARAYVHADAQGDVSRTARSRSVPAVPGRRPIRNCPRRSRRRSASSWAATSPTSSGTPPASSSSTWTATTPERSEHEELPIEDRWILSRLATTTAAVTQHLENYRFSEVARTIYDFTWSEFCDWYVEMSKGRLQDPASRPLVQRVLVGVLDGILRLVQPIMPFVAESIWQALNETAFERGLPTPEPAAESVVIASWPSLPETWQDAAMETRIGRMQELIRTVREVRNRYTMDTKSNLDVFVRCSESIAEDFRSLTPFISALAGVGRLECGPQTAKPRQAATHVTPEFEVYVSLAGLIDVDAERARSQKLLAEKLKHLQAARAKLNNANFVERAPAEVVQQQRDLVADLQNQIKAIEDNLRELSEE